MTLGVLDHHGRRFWLWLGGAVTALGFALALVLVMHRATWAGPALANGLRTLFGDRAVARLEETWAGVQDRAMRLMRGSEPPRRLEDALPEGPTPANAARPALPVVDAGPPVADAGLRVMDAALPVETTPPSPAGFDVEAIVPPFPGVAAPHDGRWFPIVDPERPAAPPLMYRTLIHPDPERSYSELFVVTMPASEIVLRLVAGTQEPESDSPELARLEPRGLIAPEDSPRLLAAFNGGFRARHGRHGMITGGVILVPLRDGLCTISGDTGPGVRIGTWRHGDVVEPGAWYRQTPPCMLEDGVMHPGLADPASRKWGATLEGETVIRRSALAVDREGRRIYVGVSNFTTGRALALGMQSVGGWTVAQLDVNWSYPKILMFPRDVAGIRRAASVFEGFLFHRDEMVRRPSERDFFYVVRR
jgi:hypothetical protein